MLNQTLPGLQNDLLHDLRLQHVFNLQANKARRSASWSVQSSIVWGDPEQPYLVRKRRFVAVKHAGVVQQNLVSRESQQTVPEPGDDLAIAQRHGLRRDKQHSTVTHLSLYIRCDEAVRSSVRLGTKRPGTRSIKAPVVPVNPVLGVYGRGVRYWKKKISILLGIFSMTIFCRVCYCADIWILCTAAVYDLRHILCAQFTSVINHLKVKVSLFVT